MLLDLPSFDFSIKPDPSELLIHQDETVSADVHVNLAGAACANAPPVNLSLHFSSSPLSFTMAPRFSSDSVIPPGKATVSFKPSSGPEIGSFVATVAGCCTPEDAERTAEMTLQILPNIPASRSAKDGAPQEVRREDAPPFQELIEKDGEVKIDTVDNILKDLQFPSELQEETRKSIETEANKGYIEASEEEVQSLKQSRVRARAAQMDQVINMLAFTPTSLAQTSFQNLNMEGAYPTGKYVNEKWTSVVRVFTMVDGSLVELIEDDLASSGGSGNVIAKEGIGLHLHGFPTAIIVQQSPSGTALSRIFWKTAAKSYNMRMEGNVKTNGKEKLFLDLAQSIPN